MSDDLKRKGPEDPNTINVNQIWELEWWSKQLGVSVLMIRIAVNAVGPSVEKVRKYLGK